jgi:hypothetical protein
MVANPNTRWVYIVCQVEMFPLRSMFIMMAGARISHHQINTKAICNCLFERREPYHTICPVVCWHM